MMQPQQTQQSAYGTFSDYINDESANSIFRNFAKASHLGISSLHLLFQSPGGNVSDAVMLYNYFLHLPFDLHIYNAGAVSSAAVVVFVGAKHRYASAHAGFLIHPARNTLEGTIPADAVGVRTTADLLIFDDNRSKDIITSRTQIPRSKWTPYDVLISAQEALQLGLVGTIGDFQPPAAGSCFTYDEGIRAFPISI